MHMHCTKVPEPSPSQATVYIHPLALCESSQIGAGTRVWAFAQVMDGAVIGHDCNIGGHAFIESGAVIGDRVTIKNAAMIWRGVTIDDDVFIGPGVIFTNDRHPRSPRSEVARQRYARTENWLAQTRIRNGASIGAGAIILPGIEIGEHAMVGAGSVVTRSVTAYRLARGNPAHEAGWVCACGQPLSQTLQCPECQRAFRLAGKRLRLAEAAHV
jgi:acetyltransferase-like isoleucine patch superfamily enzyme